jgi:hypothetical protein
LRRVPLLQPIQFIRHDDDCNEDFRQPSFRNSR